MCRWGGVSLCAYVSVSAFNCACQRELVHGIRGCQCILLV